MAWSIQQNEQRTSIGNRAIKSLSKELPQNKFWLSQKKAATDYEIAEIDSNVGCKFSGNKIKAISKENIPGIKVTKKCTSPSYSVGENGNQ